MYYPGAESFWNGSMNLSAPTIVFFLVSLIVALVGVLAAAGILTFIPFAPVWIVTIGYAILAVACMIRGA
jgi:hypothetical protein